MSLSISEERKREQGSRNWVGTGDMCSPNFCHYRGYPTYAVFTNADPTTAISGLCTRKWWIFVLVGDPLQSH